MAAEGLVEEDLVAEGLVAGDLTRCDVWPCCSSDYMLQAWHDDRVHFHDVARLNKARRGCAQVLATGMPHYVVTVMQQAMHDGCCRH